MRARVLGGGPNHNALHTVFMEGLGMDAEEDLGLDEEDNEILEGLSTLKAMLHFIESLECLVIGRCNRTKQPSRQFSCQIMSSLVLSFHLQAKLRILVYTCEYLLKSAGQSLFHS